MSVHLLGVKREDEDTELFSTLRDAIEEIEGVKIYDNVDRVTNAPSSATDFLQCRRFVLLMTNESAETYFDYDDQKGKLHPVLEQMIEKKQRNVALVLDGVEEKDLPSNRLTLCKVISSSEHLVSEVRNFIIQDCEEFHEFLPIGNVASALAWSFYDAYLVPVLKEFVKKTVKALEDAKCPLNRSIPFLKKYIILTRFSSKQLREFPNIDIVNDPGNIAAPYKLQWKEERAGLNFRPRAFDVLLVTHPKTGEKYYVIAEFLTPMQAMLDLVNSNVYKFYEEHRLRECEAFIKELNLIFNQNTEDARMIKEQCVMIDAEENELAEKLADEARRQVNREAVHADVPLPRKDQVLVHGSVRDEGVHDLCGVLCPHLPGAGDEATLQLGPSDSFISKLESDQYKWIILTTDDGFKSLELESELSSQLMVEKKRKNLIIVQLWGEEIPIPDYLRNYGIVIMAKREELASKKIVDDILSTMKGEIPLLDGLPAPNMGIPLAMSHFFGFLHLIFHFSHNLMDIQKTWMSKYPKKALAPKMISFIPSENQENHLRGKHMTQLPVNPTGIMVQVNRAGQTKRPYPIPIFFVRDPDAAGAGDAEDLSKIKWDKDPSEQVAALMSQKDIYMAAVEVPNPPLAMMKKMLHGSAGLTANRLKENLTQFEESLRLASENHGYGNIHKVVCLETGIEDHDAMARYVIETLKESQPMDST